MKLFHGTSETAAQQVLNKGLLPRIVHKNSNWKRAVQSNSKMVYLTDTYPLFFASHATKAGERMVVIEIDTADLDPLKFYADEDVLEQINRKRDGLDPAWSIRKRAAYYRKTMVDYQGMERSLLAMGTCAYQGHVPVTAITRMAFIDVEKMLPLVMMANDASISIFNYRFCRHQYQMMTQWVFGGSTNTDGFSESEKFDIGRTPMILDGLDRNSGIEVISLKETV